MYKQRGPALRVHFVSIGVKKRELVDSRFFALTLCVASRLSPLASRLSPLAS